MAVSITMRTEPGAPPMNRRSFRVNLLAALTLALGLFAPTRALADAPAASVSAPALKGETCSVQGLMDQIRRGLGSKSEAYKRYLRSLLRESAVLLPANERPVWGFQNTGVARLKMSRPLDPGVRCRAAQRNRPCSSG